MKETSWEPGKYWKKSVAVQHTMFLLGGFFCFFQQAYFDLNLYLYSGARGELEVGPFLTADIPGKILQS